MDSTLKERFTSEVLSGETDHYSFFRLLDSEEPDTVLDLYRWITSTIDYEDNPVVIKSAFSKLAHLRDLPSYSNFKKHKDRWQNTYNNEYEYLDALFENARKGQKCNCAVYQDGRFNVPPYQSDLEEIGRTVREYDGHMKTELLHVRCKICQKNWEVEIDDFYHYPHSHWRRKDA